MQPLISQIDHESRHNSYRAEDEQRLSEQTPLLHRFPRTDTSDPSNRSTTAAVVSLLLLILISGIVIGIYLLIVQSNSENILPPVVRPLQLVSEAQWNPERRPLAVSASATFTARHVIVVQTDTHNCHGKHSCAELLRSLQLNVTESLPYNFLVSSDGLTFEALGWRRPSTMFPEHPSALVLAFIGNFTQVPPTGAQIDEARNICAESVSLRRLDPTYIIIGKTRQYTPIQLFTVLSKLPQWSSSLSDK